MMDDFVGLMMLRDGELDVRDFRAASTICDLLGSRNEPAVVRRFDRALLVGRQSFGGLGVAGAFGAAGRLGICFSGSIDNRAELEKQLRVGRGDGSAGVCELVLRAYEAWGTKIGLRLRGAFSFAIYNAVTGQLFAARDQFGIRPLYHLLLADRVLFSSRLALLTEWSEVKRREVDEDVVLHYLAFGYAPTDRSPLRSFAKIKPGHSMTVRRTGSVSEERYWQLAPTLQEALIRSPDKVALELRDKLDAVVLRQSAGHDSISVSLNRSPASHAVALSAARSGLSVDSPSIRFISRKKGKAIRAAQGSRLVAEADSAVAVSALSSVAQFDEPFGQLDAIRFQAFYDLNAASGREMSAGGGDELLLVQKRYGKFSAVLAQAKSARGSETEKQTFHQTKLFKRDLYGDLVGIFSDVHRFVMAGPALAHALIHSPIDDLGTSLERTTPENGAEVAARVDLQYRTPMFLSLNDFARANDAKPPVFPFLDPDLADACAVIPSALKGYDSTDAHAGILLSTLTNSGQTGFSPSAVANDVPIDEWLRTDLRELMQDTFASTSFKSRDLFNLPWLDRLICDHLSGARQSGAQLWSLLCLDRWLVGIQSRRTKSVAANPMSVACVEGVA